MGSAALDDNILRAGFINPWRLHRIGRAYRGKDYIGARIDGR